MARPSAGYPSKRELEILNIVWRNGPQTVRQVCDVLEISGTPAAKSVLTIMSIMVKKGYLALERRSRAAGANLYSATVTKPTTVSRMLQLFSHRLFAGSITEAVQNLARTGQISHEELRKLRTALDDLSKKRQSDDSRT